MKKQIFKMDMKLNRSDNSCSTASSDPLNRIKQGLTNPSDPVIESEYKRIHCQNYSMIMKDQAENLLHLKMYNPCNIFEGDTTNSQKLEDYEDYNMVHKTTSAVS